MNRYTEITTLERDGFTVIVDMTHEDTSPQDSFDDTDHNLTEIYRKIDNGTYSWFMLRVRALLNGHEMGVAHLGGCLYENVIDVMTDGAAEDCITTAIAEARLEGRRLAESLRCLFETQAA